MRSSPWVKGHWILVSAALLPLVVLLGERAFLTASPRVMAMAGVTFALQTSCCRPDTTWLTALLLADPFA